jgi:DNA-binding MarR family transcriptional regulator
MYYSFCMNDTLMANKLGVAVTAMTERLGQACAPLAPSVAAALLWLRYQAPCTATALAPVLGLTQPTAARIIEGLQRDGLAMRVPSTRGRAAPMRLTTQGLALADDLQRRRIAALGRALAPLGADERATLDRLLDRVLKPMVTGRRYARHVCRFCDHVTCDGPLCPVGCAATAIEQREAAGGST